jgi:hypothetical protein
LQVHCQVLLASEEPELRHLPLLWLMIRPGCPPPHAAPTADRCRRYRSTGLPRCRLPDRSWERPGTSRLGRSSVPGRWRLERMASTGTEGKRARTPRRRLSVRLSRHRSRKPDGLKDHVGDLTRAHIRPALRQVHPSQYCLSEVRPAEPHVIERLPGKVGVGTP